MHPNKYSLALVLVLFVARLYAVKLPVLKKRAERNYTACYFRDSFSKRNLLGLERQAYYKFPKNLARPTHLRICAIRVEFQPDTTSKTTGNGTFDLSPREQSPYPIDPTPHDSLYFAHHLEALARYWYMVSDGKLTLEYDIFPRSRNGAYRLPHPMSYYSLDSWFTNYQDALGRLFIDGFNLAYAIDSIQYREYDVFILFHAGADLQGDIGTYYQWLDPNVYVPSPHDIPTAFITFEEPVIEGVISEGLIIPEYVSQDGQLGALNGVLAHEFGHQLGLVDLYNSYNFVSQVGDFSLMDNGGMIWVEIPGIGDVRSVLPSYPSAWERAYLGFEPIYEVNDTATNVVLQCPEKFMGNGKTIIKVPINEFEYFLIENREPNFGPDTTLYLHQDSLSGVIMGVIYENGEYNSKYDYLLPGAGILIWHIDESVCYGDTLGNGKNNFLNNALQWNPFRRFIDLEEADGVQDLGFIMTYGEPDDYFFRGNNTTFTPESEPNSNSNDNAKSYIYITNISAPGESMTLDIKRLIAFPLWMRYAPGKYFSPLVVADVNEYGDGKEVFISVDDRIYGWFGNGEKIMNNSDSAGLIDYKGDTIVVPIGTFAKSLGGEILSAPTVFDFNGDGKKELIVDGASGGFYVFSSSESDREGYARLLYHTRFEASFVLPPLPVNINGITYIFLGSSEGRFFVLNPEANEIVWRGDVGGEIIGAQSIPEKGLYILAQRGKAKLFHYQFFAQTPTWTCDIQGGNVTPLAKGDLNGDGVTDVVTLSKDGYIYAISTSDNSFLQGFPVKFAPSELGVTQPAIGDIDGDGFAEIVFCNGESLFVYSREGVREMEFPVRLPFHALGSPILFNLDGNTSTLEIVLPAINGAIYAYDRYGRILSGFPITSGQALSLASGDIDGDSTAELVSFAYEGTVYFYNLKPIYPHANSSGWAMWGADELHSFSFASLQMPEPTDEPIVSNYFNYPNPARDITYLRVNLSRYAMLRFTVYDIEGRAIFASGPHSPAGNYFELPFDTSHLPAGVYFAKLEAESDKKRSVKFTSIAVVKDGR